MATTLSHTPAPAPASSVAVLDFPSQPPTMLSYERVFSPIMVRELLTRNDRNSKASGQNNMSING